MAGTFEYRLFFCSPTCHITHMASFPVDTAASPALEECRHCSQHMLGNPIPCNIPVQRGKLLVADRTAGQQSCRGQGERVEYLLNLVIDMVALDQDVVPGEGAGGKTGVAGKDDTALLQGKVKDLVVREGVVVQHIKAEKTESLRETAQHGIGDEVHMTILPQRTDRGRGGGCGSARVNADRAKNISSVLL
ncbi:MAG: hypothetical protein H6R44_514 [Nitrospirae bacterium]|nr:hypothetical protein [Nitrospirota bacterium]